MSSAEERQWDLLLAQLGRIENKLDTKVNYNTFEKAEKELNDRMDSMEEELRLLNTAAVSPDQVSTLISTKLKEADAQGITSRERFVRYLVALASLSTFVFLVYDRWAS